MRPVAAALLTSLVLAAVVAGCGGGQASPTPAPPPTVAVTLDEWSVALDQASVATGPVKFVVTNAGPNNDHEFVVVRTDLDAGALPMSDEGTVDEAADGLEVLGEIEDLKVGESQEITPNLPPGSYALICNIEAHYAAGMWISFVVEN